MEYGALTFGAAEIYGVFTEDFENSGVPDAVWATLDERRVVKMPTHLVMIYNTGMGEILCLNYREWQITSLIRTSPETFNGSLLMMDF